MMRATWWDIDFVAYQANASLPEAAIVPRNSRMGSEIASCQVGDELEIKLPPGERYFIVSALIDLEGAAQLLRPRPEIRLARFRVADDPEEVSIRMTGPISIHPT